MHGRKSEDITAITADLDIRRHAHFEPCILRIS